ncbi:hypothetical protein [Streptomyces tauricus]|uniref:hypothetical protein n=1 Tax=Streptomyces tauricus TaxID=68274 RepID=UPI0033B886BD
MLKPAAQDRGVTAVGDLFADKVGDVEAALFQNEQDVLCAALGPAFLPDFLRER